MKHIAILEPAGAGDLVLAVPAIRALGRHYGGAALQLYVASANTTLAEVLFPDASLRPVDFPHLARDVTANAKGSADVGGLAKELDQFDVVFCLRDDAILQSLLAPLWTETEMVDGSRDVHATAAHRSAVCRQIPAYSRTALFSGTQVMWPRMIGHVGLSIAAAVPAGRWPTIRWTELALQLTAAGQFVSLIGSAGDEAELQFIAGVLGDRPHRVLQVEQQDYASFIHAVGEIDLVVGCDGPTAHLCALKKTVVSLFGPTAWRRCAPFGWSNLVISRELVCQPCLQPAAQTDGDLVHGCLTRECLASITVSQVLAAIHSGGVDFSAVRGVWVQKGTSHAYAGG